MIKFATTLLLISYLNVFAQDTTYFETERTPTLFPEKAVYYTTNKLFVKCEITLYSIKDNSKYAILNFFKESHLDSFTANGPAKYYYPNGNVQFEGIYVRNEKKGKWREFYESGKPKEIIIYDIDDSNREFNEKHLFNYRVLEYWDNFGIKSVDDGNGLYYYRDSTEVLTVDMKNGVPDGTCGGTSNNSQFLEKYKNGELIEGEIILNGKKVVYDKIFLQPQYKGGLKKLYENINNIIEYPKYAQKSNIQGKVFVKFVIDKDGKISKNETHVIKGIGYGCDEEAVRVVNMSNNWNAGMIRGRKVRVWFTIPVSFVLE